MIKASSYLTFLAIPLCFLQYSAKAEDSAAQATAKECRELKSQRDELKALYEKLLAIPTGEVQLREFDIKLEELLEILGNTTDDTNTTVGKIQQFADGLGKSPLADPLKKVAKGLNGSATLLTAFKKVVEKYHKYVHAAVGSYAGAEGSAADQIRDFKKYFDNLRDDIPGIDKIPGIDTLLTCYSDAIGHIAETVDKIEASNRERLKLPEELGGGTLECKHKSETERRADMLKGMEGQLNQLNQQIQDKDCDTPTAPVDQCPRVTENTETARNNVNNSPFGVELKQFKDKLLEVFLQAQCSQDPDERRRLGVDYLEGLKEQKKREQWRDAKIREQIDQFASQWTAEEKACYLTRVDLDGEWIVSGSDAGPPWTPSFRIKIAQTGATVEARFNVSGAFYGKVHFSGTYKANPFPVDVQCFANNDPESPNSNQATMTVVDANHFSRSDICSGPLKYERATSE